MLRFTMWKNGPKAETFTIEIYKRMQSAVDFTMSNGNKESSSGSKKRSTKKIGFAAMSKEKRRAIASKGGKAGAKARARR